ncbi:MAG: hypothetical protein HYV02_05370 [Deltaproteobacteria bacterium]|nr:hypothetical protein [Deltaproteobacteria bacterium]
MGILSHCHVVITAGPTHEAIDPVRFVANASSGKLGYALARLARERGARVTLISGPAALVPPRRVRLIRVITARDMYRATVRTAPTADIVIMAAAVADFRPATIHRHKMKRSGTQRLTLSLVANPDILATVTRRKRADQMVVGFALESRNLLRQARKKLRATGCNMLVANTVAAIGAPRQRAVLLDHHGPMVHLPLLDKTRLARRILRHAATRWRAMQHD